MPEEQDAMDPAFLKAAEKVGETAGNLITRAFGPAIDQFAISLAERAKERGELKRLERQRKNLERVAANADSKTRKTNLRAEISPRVAKRLFEEALFAENELLTEYIGGVLATAREESPESDRAVSYADLVSHMSTDEIRTHYIFYRELLAAGPQENFLAFTASANSERRLVLDYFDLALALTGVEHLNELVDPGIFSERFNMTLSALSRLELVADVIAGYKDNIQARYPYLEDDGAVIFTPTPLGYSLYLWAFGKGTIPLADFFLQDSSKLCLPEIRRVKSKRLRQPSSGTPLDKSF